MTTKVWFDDLVKPLAKVRNLRAEMDVLEQKLAEVSRYDTVQARQEIRRIKARLGVKHQHLLDAQQKSQQEFKTLLSPPAMKPRVAELHPPGKCPYCGGDPGDTYLIEWVDQPPKTGRRAGTNLTDCCHKPLIWIWYGGALVGYEKTSIYD